MNSTNLTHQSAFLGSYVIKGSIKPLESPEEAVQSLLKVLKRCFMRLAVSAFGAVWTAI